MTARLRITNRGAAVLTVLTLAGMTIVGLVGSWVFA